MENIHLRHPYKVVQHKVKKYSNHYSLPIDQSVIIPVKIYGDQILCDVLWKDGEQLHCKSDVMFTNLYLEEINAIKDYTLHLLWENHVKEVQLNS